MMRSEKRTGSKPVQRMSGSGKKPPRRRRRAGFFYKLLMLVLLLTLWPFGLIMLWRRKVRWGATTKLLTSIVTLAACVVLFGFALTVNTDNAQYTQIQDNVNVFLDDAADSLVHFGSILENRGSIALEGAKELREVIWSQERLYLADALDRGSDCALQVRQFVSGLFTSGSEGSGDSDPSKEPSTQNSPSVSPSVSATPEPTPRPIVELNVHTDDETLPIYIPTSTADNSEGQVLTSGILARLGNLEAGALPTPKPTLEPVDFTVKPAADAIVYYNDSGRYYHMKTACGSMKSAHEHRFAEVLESGHQPCNSCGSPVMELLDEPYIVWVDENDLAHLSNECEHFAGSWRLISAEDAIEANYSGCDLCAADAYLSALAEGKDISIHAPVSEEDSATTSEGENVPTSDPVKAEPTPTVKATSSPTVEPTPSPTAEPTPSPTPQLIVPKATLKPAGEALVYHSSNGRWYHSYNRCSGMTGGDAYTLAECVDNYKCCNACDAPEADLVGQACLWQDESSLCHVSDECTQFKGQYHLVLRDEALAEGLEGCELCGADEYLVPNTKIDASNA